MSGDSGDTNSINTMIENIEERQRKLLNKMCPVSSECISLGKFTSMIANYFKNFSNNEYLTDITHIGESSINGFLNALTYVKNGYTTYCVLKSSTKVNSDNLFYEWYIGKKFVNKLVSKFPCFLETYNLCVHVSEDNYKLMKTREKIGVNIDIKKIFNVLYNTKQQENILFKWSCSKPLTFAVMIQYLKPTQIMSFSDFIEKFKNTEYGFNINIFQILLQIYIPLGILSENFTHNDLHTGNVLIYILPNNSYVTLNYKFNDKNIKIKTKYIAKIIDYGRSFFKDYDDPTNSSTNLLKKLNQVNICNGYWQNPPNIKNYFISLIEANITKDLWLLLILSTISNTYDDINNPVTLALRDIFITKLIKSPDKYMSCPSTRNCNKQETICNVVTASYNLCNVWINNLNYINQMQDNEYDNKKLIGNLDIFVNDLLKDSVYTQTTVQTTVQTIPQSPSPSLLPLPNFSSKSTLLNQAESTYAQRGSVNNLNSSPISLLSKTQSLGGKRTIKTKHNKKRYKCKTIKHKKHKKHKKNNSNKHGK